MNWINTLYLSLITVLLMIGQSVSAQVYRIQTKDSQKLSVQFPGSSTNPQPYSIPPNALVFSCKDPSVPCPEDKDIHKNEQSGGVWYTRVMAANPENNKESIFGWIPTLALYEEKNDATPSISQVSLCQQCEQEKKKAELRENPLKKHDADQIPILAQASRTASLIKGCGTSRLKGKTLWDRINRARNPNAADDCYQRSTLCKSRKYPSLECKAAQAKCKADTDPCNKTIEDFEEKCDSYAGLEVKDRISRVMERVDVVLKSLPPEFHPEILTRDLVMCIIRREDPKFYPSQPSDRACFDPEATDFGLGQIINTSLTYYYNEYQSKGSRLPKLYGRYQGPEELYNSFPNDIDAQIEMMALLFNSKYRALAGPNGNGLDDRGRRLPEGCQRGPSITPKQRVEDRLRGRPELLRRTIRAYDNCGTRNYVEVIFSCMDKLRGKTEEEQVNLLSPGNKEMSGGK